MSGTRWTFPGVVALSLVVGATAACGGGGGGEAAGTLERIQDEGTIDVAISNEPPLTELKPDGEITGLAIDTFKEAMSRMGVEDINATVTAYDSMIPGLAAGTFDVAVAGLYMNAERCAEVLFSKPDIVSKPIIATATGNPMGVTSYEDMAANPEVKIAMIPGTGEERLALDAGVSEDQIVYVEDPRTELQAIQSGRAHVAALPLESFRGVPGEWPEIEILDNEGAPLQGSGVAFRAGDEEFRDAYDEVITEMHEDGTLERLAEPYGDFFDVETIMNTSRADIEPSCA